MNQRRELYAIIYIGTTLKEETLYQKVKLSKEMEINETQHFLEQT